MGDKKICKFFLKNSCDKGDQCNFVHDKDTCRNYFFDGKCKREDKCKFKHNTTLRKKHHKNTENFNPSHELLDMNILVNNGLSNTYNSIITERDVIVVPNFLQEEYEGQLYDKLLKEIAESGINEDNLWKLWHGDTHLIADDNLNWKNKVPTFEYIIKRIESYFNMDIKSTRFNLYKDSSDWKPFHHDAAAVKEHIAKIQNFTVGVSLGATRNIAFENAKTKTTISIVLPNCYAYGFAKDVNIMWKHGIPQVHPDKAHDNGRISIIAWGRESRVPYYPFL
jgi:hypothetical protein